MTDTVLYSYPEKCNYNLLSFLEAIEKSQAPMETLP
ncbi:hypothetical protein CLOLEP_02576 [[Clostridium] leptum DSM 753]|uniref:Uncharacterized protein n=1 Tax=[Clostridium] leptum DSM 753 TaxID=428125 RepID=A7VVG4_9FIRM|nr:hypothetical protein CLOLEP_02576 [[Clostridium] leptum DSM 753]